MKQLLRITILLLFSFSFSAENISILELRTLYYKASTNKDDADKFHEVALSASGLSKSVLAGYIGMSYMIKANFAINPINKLSYFNKGKVYLNGAIKADPKNTELRFLRFGVQTNAPFFLGYSGEIKEDKTEIITNFNKLTDTDLISRIKAYMINSKHCTEEDKSILEKKVK